MRQKSVHAESPSERIVKNIRRATRKHYSAEEKIRIVLDSLRGDDRVLRSFAVVKALRFAAVPAHLL